MGITYTNVAARNLRDKLELGVGGAVDRVLVTTFHGFATRLLQQHGSHIGLRPDFSIINEAEDRLLLLERAAESAGVSEEYSASRGETLLRLLGRLYERCLSADEASEVLHQGDDRLALSVFEPYVQISIAEGQLEFSLLVHLCNRLLVSFPAIARQTRRVYKYICVDEFQDTNEMQYRLLEIIAGADPSGLVLLADQDQVIYQWNGASPSRLKQASERFSLKLLLLPTSFRCPEQIVRAATQLISRNSSRFVSPDYGSESGVSADIDVVRLPDDQSEANWVADQIASVERSRWEQVGVLARNRKLLDLAMEAAVKHGVLCAAPVTKYDFISAPLVMLHSMLRLANQPNRLSVTRRLTTAFYIMTGRVVDPDVLAADAEEKSLDILTAFFTGMLPLSQSAEFRAVGAVIAEDLIARKAFRRVSHAFFAWVDALPPSSLKIAYEEDYLQERKTWEELERRHQGLKAENVTLAEFLRHFDLESKAREPADAVRFYTVHGAKGLEFNRVFLVGAAEDQFPAFQARKAGVTSEAFEEERRSFFVAVTRTLEKLTLTFADRYFGYPATESRFIGEMGLAARVPS